MVRNKKTILLEESDKLPEVEVEIITASHKHKIIFDSREMVPVSKKYLACEFYSN